LNIKFNNIKTIIIVITIVPNKAISNPRKKNPVFVIKNDKTTPTTKPTRINAINNSAIKAPILNKLTNDFNSPLMNLYSLCLGSLRIIFAFFCVSSILDWFVVFVGVSVFVSFMVSSSVFSVAIS